VAPRRKPADQRLRLLDGCCGLLSVAHISHVENSWFGGHIIAGRSKAARSTRLLASSGRRSPGSASAIIVAHTMTMEGKFQAIDRMLELAGELDRSHSFVQA
jgi:hypothetical protein